MPRLLETAFVHVPSRTLVLTDFCFNLRPPAPWPTRVHALQRRLRPRILAEDFDRVIVTHGRVPDSAGHDALRAAFAWLSPP